MEAATAFFLPEWGQDKHAFSRVSCAGGRSAPGRCGYLARPAGRGSCHLDIVGFVAPLLACTPPLEMSLLTVPTMAPHPFWWAPWWTLSPGAHCWPNRPDRWGHAPSFDAQRLQRCCPHCCTRHPCQQCRPRRRPPPFWGCMRPLAVKAEGMMPLRLAPSCKGSRPQSPACYPCRGVWLLTEGFNAQCLRCRR